MNRCPSVRKDKISHRASIVEYVRRFGPVTTSQIALRFGLHRAKSINSWLHKFTELTSEIEHHKAVWRFIGTEAK